MVRFVFLSLGFLLFGSALYQGSHTLSFVRSSYLTNGTVTENSYYRGPPRSPASESIIVKYITSSGTEETVAVAAPFLRQYPKGATIPLLVLRDDPTRARLPFLSELWKWPSILAVFGLGFICTFLLSKKRTHPTLRGNVSAR